MAEEKVIFLGLNDLSKLFGTCFLTMKGKNSFNISGTVSQDIWILDFGAIDHMTSFSLHLTSSSRAFGKQLITIANGDHVPIVGSQQSPTPALSIPTQCPLFHHKAS
ncbi:hypothetical protein CR513_06304, partial [Mucuna pruriens]